MEESTEDVWTCLRLLEEPISLQQQCIKRILESTITPDCAMVVHPKRKYSVSAYAHDRLQALFWKENKCEQEKKNMEQQIERVSLQRKKAKIILKRRKKQKTKTSHVNINLHPLENSKEDEAIPQLVSSPLLTSLASSPRNHSIPSSLAHQEDDPSFAETGDNKDP